ncbi:MAG: T9SS type A sorting domain-containing protein, partial [Flavobacteriales bacterium]|nr:T9SS type A sorting domain-containing protein [Flavobacteriales bacterium]
YDWGSAGSNDYIFGLSAGSYTVTVTDGSGCVATATAIVSEPLSIGELDNSIELLLYPNPNNGTFVVSISKEGNYNVVVRNVIGQTKENVDLNGTNKEISLNSIEAGIYFVTIKSEGFEKTEKIIVR